MCVVNLKTNEYNGLMSSSKFSAKRGRELVLLDRKMS